MKMLPVYRQSTNGSCCAMLIIVFCVVLVQCSYVSAVSPNSHLVTPTSVASTNQTKSVILLDSTLEHLSVDTNVTSAFNESVALRNDKKDGHLIFGLDTGAVKRTFYVVAGLTGIVLLYFTFKGISTMRHRGRKPRRYGLLRDGKEMRRFPDEEDDDSDIGDEDSTLFDAKRYKSSHKRGL